MCVCVCAMCTFQLIYLTCIAVEYFVEPDFNLKISSVDNRNHFIYELTVAQPINTLSVLIKNS